MIGGNCVDEHLVLTARTDVVCKTPVAAFVVRCGGEYLRFLAFYDNGNLVDGELRYRSGSEGDDDLVGQSQCGLVRIRNPRCAVQDDEVGQRSGKVQRPAKMLGAAGLGLPERSVVGLVMRDQFVLHILELKWAR